MALVQLGRQEAAKTFEFQMVTVQVAGHTAPKKRSMHDPGKGARPSGKIMRKPRKPRARLHRPKCPTPVGRRAAPDCGTTAHFSAAAFLPPGAPRHGGGGVPPDDACLAPSMTPRPR